jgi:hypothetical protein
VSTKTPRDERKRVLIPADMIDGDRESQVMILNVSRRGLLASCTRPPPRGRFVEIRKDRAVIVGVVAWSGKQVFGVRAQDNICIESLIGGRPTATSAHTAKAAKRNEPAGRSKRIDPLALQEQSRAAASRTTFISRLFIAVAAAAVATSFLYEVLSNPFNRVTEALSRKD